MRREEKRSSFQLFCSLFRKLLRRRVALYRRGVGERIIFGGEDGFIIKENLNLSKMGRRMDKRDRGRIFVMLNIRKTKKGLAYSSPLTQLSSFLYALAMRFIGTIQHNRNSKVSVSESTGQSSPAISKAEEIHSVK